MKPLCLPERWRNATADEKRRALYRELKRLDRATLERLAALMDREGQDTAARVVRQIAATKPTLH